MRFSLLAPNPRERSGAWSGRSPGRPEVPAPLSCHSEHAHDPNRHYFRGLHPTPERTRDGARPPSRGPPSDDSLGPARSGEIDDRPTGCGSREPAIRRRSRAPARPRRLEGLPWRDGADRNPLGAAGVPAANRRHRPVAHQPRGASVRRPDGPGGLVPARPRPEGRRVRAPRGRLADACGNRETDRGVVHRMPTRSATASSISRSGSTRRTGWPGARRTASLRRSSSSSLTSPASCTSSIRSRKSARFRHRAAGNSPQTS